MSPWYPALTWAKTKPEVGDVLAQAYAAWEVTATHPIDLDDDDRTRWIAAGLPDIETWPGRPYRLSLTHLGGPKPDGAANDERQFTADVHTRHIRNLNPTMRPWAVYPHGRWPKCSCCGDPMPCRAELQDREIETAMETVEMHATKIPGRCWHCTDPITTRQRFIVYPGENLDLPGGPTVRFHRKCAYYAEKYEHRWLDADPRNERILTWPTCPGLLLVHADRTTECSPGPFPWFGTTVVGVPGCQGHTSHDHGSRSACYVGKLCTRGCRSAGHPGAAVPRRPPRRYRPPAGS